MQIFHVTWKWNVPNALSLLRILLVPVFMVLYLQGADQGAFVVLVLSGLTDLLDGWIARHFHQITDCGKVLDPISDKLTQMAVVISLSTRVPELLPLMVLCVVKEICQGIGGAIMLKRHGVVRGSKWFGKISTVVFYTSMSALVLLESRLTASLRWLCIGLAGVCMLVAFIGYLRLFILVSRDGKTALASPDESEKG